MERDALMRQHQMLCYLSQIPKRIVSLHGTHNLPEFVLHELCHQNCFDLKKAAYYVDNPDFNLIKGVAGYNRQEAYNNPESVWENPNQFTTYMLESPFNTQVRTMQKESLKLKKHDHRALVDIIGPELGMTNPGFCSWDLKHDNHGILLYEKNDAADDVDNHIAQGACLLSFCPVF